MSKVTNFYLTFRTKWRDILSVFEKTVWTNMCSMQFFFNKSSVCDLTICLPDLVLGVTDPEQSLDWGGFGGETGAGLACVALCCSDSPVGFYKQSHVTQ